MTCPNCGAELTENTDVCYICGRRVEKEYDVPKTNPATSFFSKKVDKVLDKIDKPMEYDYYEEPINNNQDRDNTKYTRIDNNDRTKATLDNFIELVIILGVVLIIGFLIYFLMFKR